MPDKDLKLNSLSRFKKNSPNLILEAYSHCEVPAGCGGVVMRWRNPNHTIPIRLHFFSPAEIVQLFVDGQPIGRGTANLLYGEHMFAGYLEKFSRAKSLLIFAGVYDESEDRPRLSRKTGQAVKILSAEDGSWKFTADEPTDESWKSVDYEDGDWSSLIVRDKPDIEDWKNYRYDYIAGRGAVGIGIPISASQIWFRKRFTLVPPEQDQGETS